jgi:hypothetical protein
MSNNEGYKTKEWDNPKILTGFELFNTWWPPEEWKEEKQLELSSQLKSKTGNT